MTARFALAFAGAKTLRYKQSSVALGLANTPFALPCGQLLPKADASRAPVHAAGAAGGCQRSAPTGGAA